MSDLLGFIGDVGSALLGSNSAKKANKQTSVYNGATGMGRTHVKHRDAKTRRGSDQGWVESSPGSGWNRSKHSNRITSDGGAYFTRTQETSGKFELSNDAESTTE